MPLKDDRQLQVVAAGYLVLIVALMTLLALLMGCGPQLDHPNAVDAAVADAAPTADAWPPPTYGAATEELSALFCDYSARCEPAGFVFSFGAGSGAQAACVQLEVDYLCAEIDGAAQCASPYPAQLLPYLQECPAESAAAPCDQYPSWTTDCNTALTGP